MTYHVWHHHSNQQRKLHSIFPQCCADSQHIPRSGDHKRPRGYYKHMVDTLEIPSSLEGKGYIDDRRPWFCRRTGHSTGHTDYLMNQSCRNYKLKKKKRNEKDLISLDNTVRTQQVTFFTVLSWDVLRDATDFRRSAGLRIRVYTSLSFHIITCMDNLRNFFDAVFLQCGPTMSSGGAVFHSFHSIELFLCYQGPGWEFDLPLQPFCPKPNDPGAQRSHFWPITNCLHWHCPPISSHISVPLPSRFVPVGSQLHAAKCSFKSTANGWNGK